MASSTIEFRYPAGRDAVLLIHGLAGAPSEMRYVGRSLASAGFTVLGAQLAGHGGSEAELLSTGWHDWYRSVEQAFLDLRRTCRSVSVAGLSMGALLAIQLAARRPGEVSAIGLYSTTLWYDGWGIPRTRFLLPIAMRMGLLRNYRFVEREPFGIKDERLRRRVAAQMRQGDSAAAGLYATPARSLQQLWDLSADTMRRMQQVRCPALIAHATDDDVSSPRNALHLGRHLGGPIHHLWLDDSYHMITIDRQREHLAAETARYFRTQIGRHDPAASGQAVA